MPRDTGDLLNRFRLGEPDAIAAVARLARCMVGERGYYVPYDDRDDVVQEIVVHAHRAVVSPRFRGASGFEAFVRAIAHRRCVDWIRRHRSLEPMNPAVASEAPRPDQVLISRERIQRGRRVLGSLSSSCVRLIRLRVKEGLPYREIALRLGRSEPGVRNQMYKCLRRARAILERMDRHSEDATTP